MMTNTDLTNRLTQVRDALAQHDDLPLIELASVGVHGFVRFAAAYTDRTTRIRIVAAWAAAFGVPVVLDANANEVRAHVPLAPDVPAVVQANIGHGMVYALRAALGLSLEFDKVGPTEVSVEQLLAALIPPALPPAAPVAPEPAPDTVPAADAPAPAVQADTAPAVADA